MTETSATQPAVERVHPPNWLMRYLVNPVTRFLVGRGIGPIAERLLLLHFTGRRSGRSYDLPAGHRRIDGRLAVLTNSGWRVNFRGGRDIEITLRGERWPAHASLTEDPAEVARIYDELIDEVGRERAGRQLGIRINVDRKPSRAELEAMIERSGLAVVWLD